MSSESAKSMSFAQEIQEVFNMAVPKRKWSKQRTRTSHSNWKLSTPNFTECPQCHSLKLPHKVCKTCGFYGGREIVKMTKTAE